VLADRRLWRTAADGLVEDGHLDAEILAYAAGDEIATADEAKVPGTEKPKARNPAPNKARTPGEDK